MAEVPKPYQPDAIREKLLHVVLHMEEACQDARREIDHPTMYDDDRLGRLVARVNHAFVWAWANASVNLEDAMDRVEVRYRFLLEDE